MTIRSAIYLSGNKYKLYDKIKPHLQDGTRTKFVDIFGGSGLVSINVANDNLFEDVVWNDSAKWLYDLNCFLKNDYCLKVLPVYNGLYSKSKEDFDQLREDYNNTKSAALLYTLMCRTNSNMMRFNSKSFGV